MSTSFQTVTFILGQFAGQTHTIPVFDRQSGECLADELFRTKGGSAIVITMEFNYATKGVRVLEPHQPPPPGNPGEKAERERRAKLGWWQRW